MPQNDASREAKPASLDETEPPINKIRAGGLSHFPNQSHNFVYPPQKIALLRRRNLTCALAARSAPRCCPLRPLAIPLPLCFKFKIMMSNLQVQEVQVQREAAPAAAAAAAATCEVAQVAAPASLSVLLNRLKMDSVLADFTGHLDAGTTAGMRAIVERLRVSATRELVLDGCGIDDAGAAELAAVLPRCRLERLSLKRNRISAVGSRLLRESAMHCNGGIRVELFEDEAAGAAAELAATPAADGARAAGDAVEESDPESAERDAWHLSRLRAEYLRGMAESPALAKNLHRALGALSKELYSDVDHHFLFELLQNCDDNEYPAGVVPEVQFWQCEKASSLGAAFGGREVVLCYCNESGFTRRQVTALCSVSDSTKSPQAVDAALHDAEVDAVVPALEALTLGDPSSQQRHARPFIGEKGIGFKSVFAASDCPSIISGGFEFCFDLRGDGAAAAAASPGAGAGACAEAGAALLGMILPTHIPEEALRLMRDVFRALHGPTSGVGGCRGTLLCLPLRSGVSVLAEAIAERLPARSLLTLRKLRKLTVGKLRGNELPPMAGVVLEAVKRMHALPVQADEASHAGEHCSCAAAVTASFALLALCPH